MVQHVHVLVTFELTITADSITNLFSDLLQNVGSGECIDYQEISIGHSANIRCRYTSLDSY